jgi:hypothetical protein
MAVPWQADTSRCLSAYVSYAGEYLPTFWPARVPNDVLTQEDFKVIQNPKIHKDKRVKAFSPDSRKKWLRGFIYDDEGNPLNKPQNYGIKKFTEQWHLAGIVLKKSLGTETDLFPDEVWVETGRSLKKDATPKRLRGTKDAGPKRPDWMDRNPRELR